MSEKLTDAEREERRLALLAKVETLRVAPAASRYAKRIVHEAHVTKPSAEEPVS